MFTWYWLADLCADEGIDFVLGHALYMRAIHGGKAKNDKIDSHKIAVLLRGGTFPLAYVYPKPMRATRDLLRRRNHLAHVLRVVVDRNHEGEGRATPREASAQLIPRGRAGIHHESARKINEVLIPPNAKLLFMAMRMGPCRGLPST